MLYIDLQSGQTCHSKVMHRKEVTHSDGSYEKKSCRQAWLKIWDKVNSHGILIDWCTGREWPVNCMTVISAWCRSNMPFQILSGRLNYYITRWGQEVSELEIRWVSEKVENEKDTTLMPIRVSVNMLQFCSVSNSLSHTQPNKVRGVFFKEVSPRLLLCVVMILHLYVYSFSIWLYNKQRGLVSIPKSLKNCSDTINSWLGDKGVQYLSHEY